MRAGACTSLDGRVRHVHLVAMANPLDREIEAALRKGRAPESWKRRGTKRDNAGDQGNVTDERPTGQSGKPPRGTGMNRPGYPR
jgi:hypothetical protein